MWCRWAGPKEKSMNCCTENCYYKEEELRNQASWQHRTLLENGQWKGSIYPCPATSFLSPNTSRSLVTSTSSVPTVVTVHFYSLLILKANSIRDYLSARWWRNTGEPTISRVTPPFRYQSQRGTSPALLTFPERLPRAQILHLSPIPKPEWNQTEKINTRKSHTPPHEISLARSLSFQDLSFPIRTMVLSCSTEPVDQFTHFLAYVHFGFSPFTWKIN